MDEKAGAFCYRIHLRMSLICWGQSGDKNDEQTKIELTITR